MPSIWVSLNAAVNPLLVDVADLRTDISGLVPFLAFNTTSPVLASATGLNAMAIGSGSSASGVNSVAIGNLSNATQSNTFSVGNATTQRKIVNVASGTAPTDAVNVAQLDTAIASVTAGANPFIAINGSGSSLPASAIGIDATAIGASAGANGDDATAIGANTLAVARSVAWIRCKCS